jgi:hypothetical protein
MKGGLAILLGAGKASKMKPDDEGSSKDVSEGSDDKSEYAQGVLDAIADKDPDALAEALEAFVSCCGDEE